MRGEKFVNIVLIFLILVVVNFISSRVFVRLDLTSNKLYTLSRSSKEAVKNLDDILIVKVFFSKKLPPNLLPLREHLADLLEEYRSASGGKVRVEFIDPQKDRETEMMVMKLGIPPVQMNVLEKNKLEVVKGYLGVALFYGDKTEVIPVVERADNLEYEITSRILKLVEGGERKVGVLLKGGDHSFDEDYSELKNEIEKQYKLVEIRDSIIPEDIDLLIVAGVEKLEESDRRAIDTYLMRGGRIIFLVDGVDIGKNLEAHAAPPEPLKFLKAYGFKVNRDLVMDVSNEVAPFSSGYIRFFVPYPCWVKVRKENLSKKNPIVRGLSSIVFPWPSSIEVLRDSLIKVDTLATSTPKSWTQEGYIVINPEMLPKAKERSKKVLAILAKGCFKSAFADSAAPDSVRRSPSTAIMVVGNTRFLQDGFVRTYDENMAFFMNAVDYLGFGNKLISIRSKVAVDRPIKPISDTAKEIYKLFNTFGMAAVVVIFGLVRYFIRKREKEGRA